MSITLFLERPDEQSISVDEWLQLIERHEDLRVTTAAASANNPRTGSTVQVQTGQASSEINLLGSWLPFLSWRRGKLTTRYRVEFDNAQDPTRLKIVQIARELEAHVCNDVEDDPLDWLESDA
jgi:hypothetical protein